VTPLPLELALMALGVLGLWGGTVLTINGAVRVSERYSLSPGFVGLAILAIGTDLPELVVALGGSLQQLQGVEASGVVVGTAFGSAIAQGTLVLGVAGLFGYLPIAPRMVRRDGVVLLLSIALAATLAAGGRVGRPEGAVMVCAYLIYFVSLWQSERGTEPAGQSPPAEGMRPELSIAIGLAVIALAAHTVVTEGVAIAARVGMSQTLVGVIFVGMGTSLPELALTVRAARQGHAGLSVGNVIGSNIFDLLVPVGVAAAIYPLTVDPRTMSLDFPFLAIATLVLLVFLVRRRGLQRHEAIGLLAMYVGYAGVRVYLG
jgi:cation:H+ antiporter